jgi:site-specific recombinase XerD
MKPDTIKEMALRLVEEELSGRRFGELSRRMVRDALRDFFRWASQRGKADVRTFGKKDLVSFHIWLTKQPSKHTGEPLRPNTIKGRFQAVEMLYSCLYRSGLIAENPTHGLKLNVPDAGGWRRRPLSREEITRFLESIATSTAQGLKDRAMFELIYSSGLRVNEAASLKVSDIDFDRRFMVVRGKFDRDRKVPLSEVAQAFLLHFLGPRADEADAWVFVGSRGATKGGHIRSNSISDRFRILLRRFDMDKPEISTHSIRHSTATHLLENGASVRHVQELLGHSSIESTVRYTHVMTDGLAKIYRKHHPREHELFEAVDEEYDRRLRAILSHAPNREKHENARKNSV